MIINHDSLIYLAGHNGMVGKALKKKLIDNNFKNLVYKKSCDLDLRNQKAVETFISDIRPDIIIDAAAIVGGILINKDEPYKFLLDNMLIQNNLISAAVKNNVKNFIFLGSSCIYPKFSPQPISEKSLLTGSLEETNQWYAIAKISGVKLIEAVRKQFGFNYYSLMPTNLYGPEDNFDPYSSHVVPGMIQKFHFAKKNKESLVKLWGDGSPYREFLHVDDLADAIVFTLGCKLKYSIYNVGSSEEVTIKKLAEIISKIIRYNGDIYWDKKMPNGTPRKKINSERINKLGFSQKIFLEEGIQSTYEWYQRNVT